MEWLPRPARSLVMLLSVPVVLVMLLTDTAAMADPVEQMAVPSSTAPAPRKASPAKPARAETDRLERKSQLQSEAMLTMAEGAAAAQQAHPANKQKQRTRANQKRSAKKAQEAAAQRQRELEQVRLENAMRIQELLAKASLDYAAGRLVEPPDNNAADRYREVLAINPTQLDALAGAKRIITILAAEAERTAAAGDKDRTQQYITRIRTLQPDDGSLLELDARLKALNESPVVLSKRQQELYSRSAQSIQRAYEHLSRQPLDLQAIDQAIDEYDRAESQVAMAPGLPLLKDRIIVAFPAATRAELASDNSKRALRLVRMARSRGWLTPELELLERAAKENGEAK